MFKKNVIDEKNEHSVREISEKRTTLLGRSLKVKGNISSDEEILIEGKVDGKINIKHNVIVGANGKVNADIHAKEILIKGQVTGNVYAENKVEILPGGILNGDIVSEKVILAEGSKFKGNIDMSEKNNSKPSVNSEKKPKIQQT